MGKRLEASNRFFDLPLTGGSRVLLAVAAFVLIPVFFLPLWSIRMTSTQYPDALTLDIYGHQLVGGHGGTGERDDLLEINTLNHYIGMRPLQAEDFAEFKWIPLAVGAFILLALRASVLGHVHYIVDLLVLQLYFGVFSIWNFWHRMYLYGHSLAKEAPIKIDPFMPPILGDKQLANFHVWAYPGAATYLLGVFPLLLLAAMFLTWRNSRRTAR